MVIRKEQITRNARGAFLSQIVTQPMRENNFLDLVLVSDSNLARECHVGEKLGGCDHNLIRLKIRTGHELTENKSRIPNYRRANFNLACELLSRTTWEPITPLLLTARGTPSSANS